MKKKILIVFGTRPEAIKMAPVVKKLKQNSNFSTKVCITAQHREMLDQVLSIFKINPDYDLNLMKNNQNLSQLTTSIMQSIESVLADFKPHIVLVHGDTSTTFATSLSAFYQKIKIGHVEAGLRTGNLHFPWPEEGNRKLTAALADIHFSPTKTAKQNLEKENIDKSSIYVTGNTVIDALHLALKIIDENMQLKKDLNNQFNFLDIDKKLILVTGHRRESFGTGFENICNALSKIVEKNNNVQIIYPVHMNPNVKNVVRKNLSGLDNIFLIEPVEYLQFIYLMNKASIVLTDSGGIQEEAPSLGKPVLVMRENTERPEAILGGTAKLVGTDTNKIFNEVNNLLSNKEQYKTMSNAHNPYGNGEAASIISNILESYDF